MDRRRFLTGAAAATTAAAALSSRKFVHSLEDREELPKADQADLIFRFYGPDDVLMHTETRSVTTTTTTEFYPKEGYIKRTKFGVAEDQTFSEISGTLNRLTVALPYMSWHEAELPLPNGPHFIDRNDTLTLKADVKDGFLEIT